MVRLEEFIDAVCPLLSILIYLLQLFPGAFALDLFGCGRSTFSLGAAGAMSFHDPHEGTETISLWNWPLPKNASSEKIW
jgi:hypothetical protein